MPDDSVFISVSRSRHTLFLMNVMIFLMGIGTGMTAPAIPLIGKGLGATFSQIGFFMTGYSAAYALLTVVAGSLSDIFGRKKLLLFSLVMIILASVGYYFAHDVWTLLIFRTLEGVGWGTLWPVSEAILADNSTMTERGWITGKFSAFYAAGVAIGSFCGGLLMQYVGLAAMLPLYPIIGILVFLLIWPSLREVRPHKHHTVTKLSSLADLRREIKKIWPLCYVGFAYTGFLYSVWGLLSMVAQENHISFFGIGVIFALFWFCRLAFNIVASFAQNKFGRRFVLLLGIVLVTLAAAMLVLVHQFSLILFAIVLDGLGSGILFPMVVALVADVASPGYRGFALGFMEFTASLGMIVQTAIAGVLGQLGGTQYTYLFSLFLCALAVLVATGFVKEKPVTLVEQRADFI